MPKNQNSSIIKKLMSEDAQKQHTSSINDVDDIREAFHEMSRRQDISLTTEEVDSIISQETTSTISVYDVIFVVVILIVFAVALTVL